MTWRHSWVCRVDGRWSNSSSLLKMARVMYFNGASARWHVSLSMLERCTSRVCASGDEQKCALQVLLGYCDSFAQDNDVKYNTMKTVCMLVRPKEFKSDFVPCFELAGLKLKCVSTNKYPGVHIATDQKDDRSIRQQCRNIYNRVNTIIRNFQTLQWCSQMSTI